jgi:hypothetical protein
MGERKGMLVQNSKHIPWSYRVAVYLLALEGIWKVLEFGLQLWKDGVLDIGTFGIGILVIHAAASLLEFKRIWWYVSLVWLAIRAVLFALNLPLLLLSEPLAIMVKSPSGGLAPLIEPPLSTVIRLIFVSGVLLFCIWQWWAIGRPTALRLFRRKAPMYQAANA